jgi:hypothetical protein
MTTPLGPGHLIVAPADVALLAILVREGTLAIGARRALPSRVGPLLAAVEAAALAARSGGGTVIGAAPATQAPCTATVFEAAKELHVSEEMVRRMCRTGALVAQRRGPVWLIDRDSVTSHALTRRAVA